MSTVTLMEDSLTARMQALASHVAAIRPAADAEARRAERDALEQEATVQALRARWNAPRRQLRARPLRDGPWGDRLDRLQARLGTGIIVGLLGPRGTGKTQMAVELMKAVTAGGRPALFRTAAELLMHFKATYRPEARDSELDVIAAHRRPSLLVIDEYARRTGNPWEDNLLFELLNQRYADLTDTLLTSSQDRPSFESSLGPSLTSRLHEGGGIIECHWSPFRHRDPVSSSAKP